MEAAILVTMAKTNRMNDELNDAALDEINIDDMFSSGGFFDDDIGIFGPEIEGLPPPDNLFGFSNMDPEPAPVPSPPKHQPAPPQPNPVIARPPPLDTTTAPHSPIRRGSSVSQNPIPFNGMAPAPASSSGTTKKKRKGAGSKRKRNSATEKDIVFSPTTNPPIKKKRSKKDKTSMEPMTRNVSTKDSFMTPVVTNPVPGKQKTNKRRTLPMQKRKSIEPPPSIHPPSATVKQSISVPRTTTTSSSSAKKLERKIKISPTKSRRASSKKENAFFPFTNIPVSESEPFNTMYPNLYKIFSSSSSERESLRSNGNSNTLMNVVFQFVGTRIEISEAQLDPAAQLDPNYVNSLKNRDVHIGIDEASIGLSKNFLAEMNRIHVVDELRNLLAKVKQQSNFLKKQVYQMNTWCKENYDMSSSTSGVGSSSSKPPHGPISTFHASTSQLALSMGVSEDIVEDVINAKDKPCFAVKVKIKCVGLKKPNVLPLDAHFVPLKGTSSELIKCGVPIFKRPKKKEVAPPIVVPQRVVKPPTRRPKPVVSRDKMTKKPPSNSISGKKRTYESMNYFEKRNLIKKLVAERAYAFEQSVRKADKKRQDKVDKRLGKVNEILEKHVDHAMTSEDFWEMTSALSHWQNKSKQDIIADLSPVWQPELSKRQLHWSEPPTPIIVKSGAKPAGIPSTGSIFNRLQSLLVEETIGDKSDEESSLRDGEDDSDDDDDDDLESIAGIDLSCKTESDLVDLSDLSLDQRTYIHLRSVHLIDQPLLPSMVPSVVEKEESEANTFVHDSIDAKIREMQMKLSDKHKDNNTKISLLKRLAIDEISHSRNRDEEIAIIAKFNNLSKGKSDKVQNIQRKKVDNDTDEWVPT